MEKNNEPTTSVNEARKDIGHEFVRDFAGLQVKVIVEDVKFSYGRKRWLVRAAGQKSSKTTWINAPKI